MCVCVIIVGNTNTETKLSQQKQLKKKQKKYTSLMPEHLSVHLICASPNTPARRQAVTGISANPLSNGPTRKKRQFNFDYDSKHFTSKMYSKISSAKWQPLCSGPWFNMKMSSYPYRKSHCGDKTVVRSSYLHNGISYTGKMTSLYWIRAQASTWLLLIMSLGLNPFID